LIVPHIPEYAAFFAVSSISLIALVVVTLLTPPTPPVVLSEFYRITKPFGFWKHVHRGFDASFMAGIKASNSRDILAVCVAVPWQMTLFLFMMMIVLKEWSHVVWLGGLLAVLSFALYHLWFKRLVATSPSD
jgi:hypothetical protein